LTDFLSLLAAAAGLNTPLVKATRGKPEVLAAAGVGSRIAAALLQSVRETPGVKVTLVSVRAAAAGPAVRGPTTVL
jgi:hypothetical protein